MSDCARLDRYNQVSTFRSNEHKETRWWVVEEERRAEFRFMSGNMEGQASSLRAQSNFSPVSQ